MNKTKHPVKQSTIDGITAFFDQQANDAERELKAMKFVDDNMEMLVDEHLDRENADDNI